MSEQNVNRKQMYIIILDALALKVTMPNLLAVGVLNINPRKYRENYLLLLTELLCIFNKNESIFNLYSEQYAMIFYIIDYSVSVPEHLQNK